MQTPPSRKGRRASRALHACAAALLRGIRATRAPRHRNDAIIGTPHEIVGKSGASSRRSGGSRRSAEQRHGGITDAASADGMVHILLLAPPTPSLVRRAFTFASGDIASLFFVRRVPRATSRGRRPPGSPRSRSRPRRRACRRSSASRHARGVAWCCCHARRRGGGAKIGALKEPATWRTTRATRHARRATGGEDTRRVCYRMYCNVMS